MQSTDTIETSAASALPRRGSVLSNIGWLAGDRIFRMGVGLVVIVWIARYLGPEQFGLLSYATAFVSLFSFLSSLGLDSLIVRELVNKQIETADAMGTAFGLKMAGGLAALLLSVSMAIVMDRGEIQTVTLVAISAIGSVFQATDVLDYYFQARAQTRYITIARGFAFQTLSVSKLVFIVAGAPLVAFALAGVGEIVLGAFLLCGWPIAELHPVKRPGVGIRPWH